MTSIFLPLSASTQISYLVKFNMADKVHRLSLAASFVQIRRHCIIRCLLLATPPRYFSIQAISTAIITNLTLYQGY